MIKQKRKRKKRLKIFLTVLLIIAIIAAAGVFLFFKVFIVTQVEVEGNKIYDNELIEKNVLNDDMSWSTLYVFLKYKFTDTKEVPFVESMEIGMKLPNTIHIKVYEKGLLGYIYISSMDKNAYFDKDGFVVEISNSVIENVPKVTGVTVNTVVLYEQLPIETKVLKALLSATQTLKKYSLTPEIVTYEGADNLSLSYGDIEVELGDTGELNEKIVRLMEIMPALEGMQGILHLDTWSKETPDISFEKSK